MSNGRSREIGVDNSARDGEPELSVLLVTETIELARETFSHLAAQSAAGKIELVLAIPGGTLDEQSVPELQGLHSVRALDWDPEHATAEGRAAAVPEASAPIVVFAETHCFPQPGWAEALIDAHRGPWPAVGPAVENDNPDSAASWGNFLPDYGPWIPPVSEGDAGDLPGHNSSYKRSVLLGYGSVLGTMLEVEWSLHRDLRSKGHRICLEPRAIVRHRNITHPRSSVAERFHGGRSFGAARARDWSTARRILYVAASPLVPIVRMARILRLQRRKRIRNLPRGTFPMTALVLAANATGEAIGYLRGTGRSLVETSRYEVNSDGDVRTPARVPVSDTSGHA